MCRRKVELTYNLDDKTWMLIVDYNDRQADGYAYNDNMYSSLKGFVSLQDALAAATEITKTFEAMAAKG